MPLGHINFHRKYYVFNRKVYEKIIFHLRKFTSVTIFILCIIDKSYTEMLSGVVENSKHQGWTGTDSQVRLQRHCV